ncbi:hypothetical protein RHS01_08471 [Rhizoctonia solani]|uniref:Uncharacterized protein n=1 Tax=Rhizoctonia solani TaxID=456999 RepID=A0A8H7I7F9_9AGAM|nr:hypothetical protein RHS01_08471 [Rhizoctonia solani]
MNAFMNPTGLPRDRHQSDDSAGEAHDRDRQVGELAGDRRDLLAGVDRDEHERAHVSTECGAAQPAIANAGERDARTHKSAKNRAVQQLQNVGSARYLL